jgi:glycosyltransferase involved in cell wall biosynthesis
LARVCVVSIAYNSAAALRGMLASVPPGLGVIVVDNASADDSVAVAEAAGARVIRNGVTADNQAERAATIMMRKRHWGRTVGRA